MLRWLAFLPVGALYIAYLLPLPALPKTAAIYGVWLMVALQAALGAAGRSRKEPRLQGAWLLFGLSMVLVALNAFLVLARMAAHTTQAPPPSLVSFLVMTVSLLLTAGAIHAFSQAFERERRGRQRILDGTIFAVAFYFLLWLWVIKPLQHAGAPPLLYWGWQGVFITLSASLGIAAHALTARDVPLRSPAGILTLAFALFAVVVPFWVRIILQTGPQLLHPVRMILFLAYPLSLWATMAPWPVRRGSQGRLVFRLVLPYLPAILAFGGGTVTYLARASERDGTGLALLAFLAWLLLIRQGLAIHEIWYVNRHLEQKVEARTRELQASQALVARTQQMNLIATLGAGLAHDLNNLLGAAMTYLELAQDQPERLPEETSRDLDKVAMALLKAGSLTQRILTMGRQEEAPSTVELTGHLRDLEPLLRALVPKDISLGLALQPGPMVLGLSPATLDQVIVNLVSNARDATPAGGSIHLDAREEAAWFLLEVADSGTGIAPDILEHIFDPFYTTKPSHKGTGLGLASVRSVVEALGGHIEVESLLGTGSRFIVHLPKAAAA